MLMLISQHWLPSLCQVLSATHASPCLILTAALCGPATAHPQQDSLATVLKGSFATAHPPGWLALPQRIIGCFPFPRWGIKSPFPPIPPWDVSFLIGHNLILKIKKKKGQLIFFCNTGWSPSQYHIGEGEVWPLNGTLNYTTILQLSLFCKCLRKWSESPYIQVFFYLRGSRDLCKKCELNPTNEALTDPQMLTEPSPAPGIPEEAFSLPSSLPRVPSTTAGPCFSCL